MSFPFPFPTVQLDSGMNLQYSEYALWDKASDIGKWVDFGQRGKVASLAPVLYFASSNKSMDIMSSLLSLSFIFQACRIPDDLQ